VKESSNEPKDGKKSVIGDTLRAAGVEEAVVQAGEVASKLNDGAATTNQVSDYVDGETEDVNDEPPEVAVVGSSVYGPVSDISPSVLGLSSMTMKFGRLGVLRFISDRSRGLRGFADYELGANLRPRQQGMDKQRRGTMTLDPGALSQEFVDYLSLVNWAMYVGYGRSKFEFVESDKVERMESDVPGGDKAADVKFDQHVNRAGRRLITSPWFARYSRLYEDALYRRNVPGRRIQVNMTTLYNPSFVSVFEGSEAHLLLSNVLKADRDLLTRYVRAAEIMPTVNAAAMYVRRLNRLDFSGGAVEGRRVLMTIDDIIANWPFLMRWMNGQTVANALNHWSQRRLGGGSFRVGNVLAQRQREIRASGDMGVYRTSNFTIPETFPAIKVFVAVDGTEMLRSMSEYAGSAVPYNFHEDMMPTAGEINSQRSRVSSRSYVPNAEIAEGSRTSALTQFMGYVDYVTSGGNDQVLIADNEGMGPEGLQDLFVMLHFIHPLAFVSDTLPYVEAIFEIFQMSVDQNATGRLPDRGVPNAANTWRSHIKHWWDLVRGNTDPKHIMTVRNHIVANMLTVQPGVTLPNFSYDVMSGQGAADTGLNGFVNAIYQAGVYLTALHNFCEVMRQYGLTVESRQSQKYVSWAFHSRWFDKRVMAFNLGVFLHVCSGYGISPLRVAPVLPQNRDPVLGLPDLSHYGEHRIVAIKGGGRAFAELTAGRELPHNRRDRESDSFGTHLRQYIDQCWSERNGPVQSSFHKAVNLEYAIRVIHEELIRHDVNAGDAYYRLPLLRKSLEAKLGVKLDGLIDRIQFHRQHKKFSEIYRAAGVGPSAAIVPEPMDRLHERISCVRGAGRAPYVMDYYLTNTRFGFEFVQRRAGGQPTHEAYLLPIAGNRQPWNPQAVLDLDQDSNTIMSNQDTWQVRLPVVLGGRHRAVEGVQIHVIDACEAVEFRKRVEKIYEPFMGLYDFGSNREGRETELYPVLPTQIPLIIVRFGLHDYELRVALRSLKERFRNTYIPAVDNPDDLVIDGVSPYPRLREVVIPKEDLYIEYPYDFSDKVHRVVEPTYY